MPRGGLLKLLDAYVAIGGDMSGLDTAIDQSAAKAIAAGDRVEQAFSPRKIIGALAVATGAVFGVMTRGGLELNQTLTDVQARSGAVGSQWDAMSAAIQRQNQRTTLSLSEIGDGVEAIKTDLQATASEVGVAADRLTDFGLVARETFASAVKGADNLHDAYQLTVAETLAILDALVVSHERYGGDLVANRDALVALAPALRGANLGWQDGLELINLFNSAGVDASVIPLALQRALEQVHSPTELKNLIADIQSTEDPFLRAQKAADLFGSRAGAKMANALAPGLGALSDYAVTVDESAGATDKAARKIDSSWTRTFQLMAQHVTGMLSQIGNAIGPVLGIAGAIGSAVSGFALLFPGLGPKMIGGLKTLFAKLIPGAVAGGTLTGSAAGAAFTLAFGAAAAIAVIAVFATVKDQLDQQGAALVAQTTDYAAKASLEALKQSRAGVAEQLAKSKEGFHPIEDFFGMSGTRDIQKTLDVLDAEVARRTGQIGTNASQSLVDGATSTLNAGAAGIQGAAGTAFGGVPNAVAAQVAPTRAAILALLNAAAQEVSSSRSRIDSEISALNELNKKPDVNRTTELERLLKTRTSPGLLKDLKSPDIEKRTAARQLAADLDETIALLNPRPGIMSATSKKLIEDLKTSTNTELQAFGAWFQLVFNQTAANAITSRPAFREVGPNASPEALAARQKAVQDAVNAANVGIGSSDTTAAALHNLLKSALASADPLIKNDAQIEGAAFSKALTDAMANKTATDNAAASAKALAQAVVTFLQSGQAKAMVQNAWNALTNGLTLQVPSPSGIPVPQPGPTPPPGVDGAASGLPYVTRDQLLYIHKGEAVLTAAQADDWRSGGLDGAAAGGGSRSQSIYIDTLQVADANDEESAIQRIRWMAAAQA